jgi:hypothetical protein
VSALIDRLHPPCCSAGEHAAASIPLDRRSVLLRGALGVGLLAGGSLLAAACGDEAAISVERSETLARLIQRCGAVSDRTRPLGLAYLQVVPEEADVPHLVRALFRGWSDADLGMRPDALCSRLRDQSREDFGLGRHIVLGGWVVSRTEARIAALAGIE